MKREGKGWDLGGLLWGGGGTRRIAESVRIVAHEDVVIVLASFIIGRMRAST